MVLIVNVSSGRNFYLFFTFCLFFLFSKLQSDLRTTNLEELKITVESYFEEVTQQLYQLTTREKQRSERTLNSVFARTSLLVEKKKKSFLPGVISPLTVSAVSDPAVEDAAGSFREEVRVPLLIQSSLCVCVTVTSSSRASPVSNECYSIAVNKRLSEHSKTLYRKQMQ